MSSLYNSQYYFAPAAQPLHESITDWQKEFQEIVGKNNATYFDKKGWLYFTDETFDLLYPGYGDTYPTFNGAIGMTYEMPGHSKAGLAVTTEKGDILTLANRIEMHFTTTMSTLESCYENRRSLLNEFSNYFNETQQKDTYYVLRSKTPDRIAHLTELLDKNKIKYKSPASAKKIKAYAYSNDENLSVDIRKGDLIIPQDQPKSKLVTVLFERNTKLTDTLTYDITAWSLPFVYGLDAYQVHGKMDLADYHPEKHLTMKPDRVPYSFLLNWTSISDAKFLSAILSDGYKVNYSTKSFQQEAINYNPGTLIITRNDNEEKWDRNFDKLRETAEAFHRNLIPVYSGSLNSSMNIGSQKINFLKKPKIAMLSGDGISTRNFGELWYFFEQEINYPIDIINKRTIGAINIADYDVMILASGKYPALQNETGFEKLDKWIKDGGNLILIEEAINEFIGDNKFSIEKNDPNSNEENEKQPILYAFEENERENLKKYIKGGIIKIDLDNTHPLVYGYENHYYTLKDNGNYYKFLQDGWNVGYISSDDKVIAGFVGSETKKKLNKNLVFGVEQRERGKVIYVADNPLFRAFWHNGKLLMANAIFFNN